MCQFFSDELIVGNSLIGGSLFKNSRLNLGNALEAGLTSLSTENTDRWETLLEPIGEGSEGDREGVPRMGSLKIPKDLHKSISSWVAGLSEWRTDRNKEASEDKLNSKEKFSFRLTFRMLDKDEPKAIMKKCVFCGDSSQSNNIYDGQDQYIW